MLFSLYKRYNPRGVLTTLERKQYPVKQKDYNCHDLRFTLILQKDLVDIGPQI